MYLRLKPVMKATQLMQMCYYRMLLSFTIAHNQLNILDTNHRFQLLKMFMQARVRKRKHKYNCTEIIYSKIDYLDDLILSSIALYKSTNNQSYLDDALGLYQLSDWRTNHTEPLDWDNKV